MRSRAFRLLPTGIILLVLLLPSYARPAQKAILFHSACSQCRRVLDCLDRYGVSIERRSLQEPGNTAALLEMYKQYKVPPDKWDGSLALFTEDKCITGEERVIAWIKDTAKNGSGKPLERKSGAVELHNIKLPLAAVAAAGLADGINPCAFATFLLFASYLAMAGRGRKTILLTGLVFAAGIFIAYLGIGWSIFKAIRTYAFDNSLGRVLNAVLGCLSIAGALYSYRDYRLAKSGRSGEMALKMPETLRRVKQRVLRTQMKKAYLLPAVFLAGFAVSLLELACTGQIYLPTLAMIASMPEKAHGAYSALFIYAGMFISPLLCLTLLISIGMPASAMTAWGRKTVPASKMALSVIFLLAGVWLFYLARPG